MDFASASSLAFWSMLFIQALGLVALLIALSARLTLVKDPTRRGITQGCASEVVEVNSQPRVVDEVDPALTRSVLFLSKSTSTVLLRQLVAFHPEKLNEVGMDLTCHRYFQRPRDGSAA